MLRVSSSYFSMPSIALLLATFSYCLHAHAIDDCELDGQYINVNNGAATVTKTGLIRCKDRSTGQLRREYEIQDGVNKGLVRYYRQGYLELEFSRNAKGNKHGLAKKFNEDGLLIQKETYDNGSTVGISQFWYPNGKRKRATYYEKGKSGQQASVSWTQEGLLSQLQCNENVVLKPVFDDHKYCGHRGKSSTVDLYSHRGVLSSRSTFLSGKKQGYQTFWNDGKTLASELIIKSGIKIKRKFSSNGAKLLDLESVLYNGHYYPKRERVYDESGPLVNEKRWLIVDGYEVLESESSFYFNGQPKTREQYIKQDQLFVIESKNFHDNGKLSFEGRYLRENRYNQRPDGVHRFFNNKGIVIQALHYDDKGRVTREQNFSAEGKLISDEEVFADGSRRAYAK